MYSATARGAAQISAWGKVMPIFENGMLRMDFQLIPTRPIRIGRPSNGGTEHTAYGRGSHLNCYAAKNKLGREFCAHAHMIIDGR